MYMLNKEIKLGKIEKLKKDDGKEDDNDNIDNKKK